MVLRDFDSVDADLQVDWAETATFERLYRTKKRKTGKLSLSCQKSFTSHRCGWNYAIQALQPLHSDRGILFDGYLENSFVWKAYQPGQVKVPYNQPWVGFLHNPPHMPEWFAYEQSPQRLLKQADWQRSMEYCVGLFCLSEYHARWLRECTSVPVSALIHPTELSVAQFSFDRFVENANKKIVHVGWWLRKLNAIYQLPIARDNALGYRKVKLAPKSSADSMAYIAAMEESEKATEELTFREEWVSNTYEVDRLKDEEYDRLLCENVVFVDLYDSSANNVVIECIARATPLLVNPLPAVMEYLGEDYPLYFDTLAEAAKKAMDVALIGSAHRYLKTCEVREKLSAEYFCRSFEESEVYRCV